MKAATFQEVPLSDIVLSGDNKRRIDEKDEQFKELVASIAARGVRVPILVRPAKKKGKYELRYGERRYRASIAAGAETIPAIVSEGMDDEEALDVTFVENQFREGLKPMEEVAQVAMWMDRLRGDAKAIAAGIGRPEKWVRLRANIHGHLAKCWRDIFQSLEKYPMFGRWTVTHLTLIAHLPAHIQEALYKSIKGPSYNPPFDKVWTYSTRDLEGLIGSSLHLLSKAKWDLADETLIPKAGSCSKCVKRSGHQPHLWFDTDEQAEAGDQCLDGFCWIGKSDAWLKRLAKQLKDEHGGLLYITKNYPDYSEAAELGKAWGTYLNKQAYKTVSKSTKGAVAAMYVNGVSAGQLTYIKPQTQSEGSGTSRRGSGAPRVTPLKVRAAQLDAKRWAQMLLDLKGKVNAAQVGGITYKNKTASLMALVAGRGNRPLCRPVSYGDKPKVSWAVIEELAKSGGGQDRALELLWQSFLPTLDYILTYNGPITQTPPQLKNEAAWIAELIGVDLKAMFKDVCGRKGFGEPKSWAGLNADGTPKADKPKKAKDESKEVAKTKGGK